MSRRLLGETFDIHGGGLDLVFPHHENELAQSECCHGKPMVKYWMHNGLLRAADAGKLGGRAERERSDPAEPKKMSRSAGAGGLADLIRQFGGPTLRFFLLRTHYRSTIVFGEEGLREAATALETFTRLFERYARITGESFYALPAIAVADDEATLALGALEYQVLIPEFTRRRLQSSVGEEVSLHTIHYLDGNSAHGRITPRLVGFLTEVEREFFELFCSVDGVGVKKALRAMVRPVREVATLIEEQDAKGLAALPGVGPATAERVIAKLRRKMPKFALLVAREETVQADVARDVIEDTFQILCQLGHGESDARRLLDGALANKRKFKDVESLLQAVYENRGAR